MAGSTRDERDSVMKSDPGSYIETRLPLASSHHRWGLLRYTQCGLCEMLRSGLFSLLIILPLLSNAQDHPAGTTVLPFQQDAVTANNEDQIAMQYFQARNFEQAAEIYALIYPKRPTYYTYTYYFFCLVELREYDEARKLIKTQQKTEPDALKYQVDLGYVYFREGNTAKAKKLYDDALKRLPADARQLNELANAFYSKGELDYVISTYKRGRELMPEIHTITFELASAYERTGNFKGAIEEYLSLLTVDRNYEPTVRNILQTLLAQDDDNSKNEIFRKTLLEYIQKAPDRVYYSEMLWWYSVQQKDFELALIQAKALDRRLKEDGNRIMDLANLAVSNGNFDVADEAYNYIIAKGASNAYYEAARRDKLHTGYIRLTGDPGAMTANLGDLQKSMIAELGRWENDPGAVRLALDLAHLDAFYLNSPEAALDLLDRVTGWRGLAEKERADVKMELADIHLYYGDLWTATVLYQQIYRDFKNDATGQEAKFRNARLSYYMGEFPWAKAQLDILKAATAKFISNDALELSMLISNNYDPDSNTVALGIYSRAELADFRNNERLALQTLDSIPMLFKEHPILENVNYRKGEIYVKLGKYALADSMFAIVIRNHPVDIITDEALMNRAVIHETWLADKQGAMALYQELLNTYPGSLFVPEARKRYRTLRGDTIH
ncbi:MAG: tetratricopeptide repeat protein [Bacteroidetes bacterium]|nr:tetratricopeptide repeat protein [Bacteroidota bacterium]